MTFNISDNPLITLNNGQKVPQLGLGVYKVQQDVAVHVVEAAIERGYRRIDTAALYDNEVEVGAGIRRSGIGRENIYVTTKIWNDRQGYDNALEAIDESLMRLNIDYIDMLLIHYEVADIAERHQQNARRGVCVICQCRSAKKCHRAGPRWCRRRSFPPAPDWQDAVLRKRVRAHRRRFQAGPA